MCDEINFIMYHIMGTIFTKNMNNKCVQFFSNIIM